MPPARTHFWQVVARVYARRSSPRNTPLNCTIPAFVNRSVGSSPGTSGDEGTRVCPLRSKYLRNASRISSPVMASLGVQPAQCTHDLHHDATGVAEAQEVVAQPGGRPAWVPAHERRQPLPPGLEGPRPFRAGAERLPDRRLGHRGVDAAGAQLRAEPRRAEPADRGARLHPATGELDVVEVAAGLELADDRRRDLRRRPAAPEASQQVAPAPRLAGEQIDGDRARRLQVKDRLAAAAR